MKVSTVLASMALISSSLAAPMAHEHHHHKREAAVVYVTHTVVVDSNGQLSTLNAQVAVPTTDSSESSSATSTSKATSTSSSSKTSTTSTSSSSSSSGSSSGSSSISGDLSDFSGPTEEFEDGTIKCSDFPSGQGVVAVDWLGFGGWASIMKEDGTTSSSCEDGFYCSYACQAGMSKTQYPSTQPSDGKSIGGLYCKNGYLYKSNSNSKYLCEWGQDSGYVQSSIDKDIALCRTDYPGSENMVVPTLLEAGGKAPLSVVDEDNYYHWQGGKTSAQYYVNNAGVSIEDGCVWGDSSSGVGNWAPLVIGSGYTNGNTYLSLIPNPNNKDAPNYNVKIEATDGSVINGDCSYINGNFNGDNTDGCTVTVTKGSAVIKFY
ncbi:hypothetical protein KL918_002665 [Ogataea parapolymorpha]|uniref:Protein UTH1 n=1 Tax=Ogataea parapolymorpha (strain ATCC 26012 / BCRC 20466 / JCM 22074 / NRRL Y-7560 / DL-1) TaxID=871575 RepID=W1QG21_OGAPD|nr:Protein UTH1 [Ogataea parapolymorpha DL-1]ESX01022.1 Protein UTH1 [Ogataea parapolymorpha DL-1]KAG7867226.1 hypothetical protein KL918_002665 [Ogataea parapolymorpha]KAG7870768.1 hypothetical protein KL916_004657 [Ogataea parapolymorpha]